MNPDEKRHGARPGSIVRYYGGDYGGRPGLEGREHGDSPHIPREIVIEVPSSRSGFRYWVWGIILALGLVAAAYVLWDRALGSGAPTDAELAATVEAIVDARLAAEQTQPAGIPAPEQPPTSTTETEVSGIEVPEMEVPATVDVPEEPEAEVVEVTLAPVPSEPETAAVSSGGLATGPVPPAIGARATFDLINLRSGPSEEYEVLAVLDGGGPLEVTGRNGDGSWLFVRAGQLEGWVAGWLLSVDREVSSVAVRPDPSPDLSPFASPTAHPTPALVTVSNGNDGQDGLQAGATQTPVPSPSSPQTPFVASPSHPCLVGGYFWLIHPVETTVHNQVTFRWGFSGQLPDRCGFEVLMWRVGQTHRGVHDAVADNRNGVVKLSQQNEYRLDVPFLSDLPSVNGQSGEYFWTVAVVQIEPGYQSFGRQAEPGRFFLDLPAP